MAHLQLFALRRGGALRCGGLRRQLAVRLLRLLQLALQDGDAPDQVNNTLLQRQNGVCSQALLGCTAMTDVDTGCRACEQRHAIVATITVQCKGVYTDKPI